MRVGAYQRAHNPESKVDAGYAKTPHYFRAKTYTEDSITITSYRTLSFQTTINVRG